MRQQERLAGADFLRATACLLVLAHHFALAAPGGDAPKAVDLARRAGDQASQLLAHEEAAELRASV